MLRVYIKPPGEDWVEYTPVVRPDRTFEIGGRAYNGEADQGEITVDDPDYTLDVYEELASGREVKITVDDSGSEKVLALGRIVAKSMERGSHRIGREVTFSIDDVNSELKNIIVNKWGRPAESGLNRVKALRLSHLHGSLSTSTFARDSTNIDIDDFVPTANEITMPAKFYEGTDPLSIIRECAEWEGKLFFVYPKDNGDKELFYARPNDLTLHNCTLEVSDDPTDIDYATVFPIAWVAGPALNMNGQETRTGILFIHPDGERTYDNDTAAEALYDKQEEAMFVEEPPGAAADAHLAAVIAARNHEDVRRQGALQLPESKVHLIKQGMLLHVIQANAAAVPNVTGGSQKYRIAQVRYRWLGPHADDDNKYYVIVTLEVVHKLFRHWGPSKPGAQSKPPTPMPAPQCEIPTGDSLTALAANNDGEWPGSFPNTSPCCGPNFHDLGASGGHGDFPVSPSTGYLLALVIAANRHAYTVKTTYYDGDPNSGGVQVGQDTHALGIIGTDNGCECPTPQIQFTTPADAAYVRFGFEAKLGGWRFQAVFSEVTAGAEPADIPNCVDYADRPHANPSYLPADYVEDRFDLLEAAIDELNQIAGEGLDWFNVKDYGAVGDGTTDDTAAIQAAIDAAEAVNGTVYFPIGTYKVTSALSVTAGIRMIGANIFGAIIQQATSNTSAIVATTDAYRLYIENLTIDGPATHASGTGISVVRNLVLHDVLVQDFATGISLGTSSWYSKINRAIVASCTTGIDCTDGSNNVDITDTLISTATTGIYVRGTEKVRIVGGSSETCTTYGIRVDSGTNDTGGVTIEGVYFENGSGCTDIAIGTVNDTVRGGTILGNKFTNGVTRHLDIQYAEAFTIGGNDFRDTGSTVRIQDPATGIVILPNRNDGTYTTNSGTTVIPDDIGDAIQETLIDAKGDLIAGSAADTAIRVAVGANGDVLTADSTATGGVSWQTPSAGGSSAQILLESGHAVPFTFDEILQESDGSGFLYASE